MNQVWGILLVTVWHEAFDSFDYLTAQGAMLIWIVGYVQMTASARHYRGMAKIWEESAQGWRTLYEQVRARAQAGSN